MGASPHRPGRLRGPSGGATCCSALLERTQPGTTGLGSIRWLGRRKHPNVVIVAVARRLLVAVWHVLTERVADRNAVPEMVAFKLMIWSWKLTDQQRGGLTSRQFMRYGLQRLELGDNLTHISTGKATRRAITSPEEVLALHPELRSRA